MKIVYLLPLSLPSTRQVANIVYLKKKGRIERFLLTISDISDLWEGRVEGTMFFSLKVKNSIPRNRDRQRLTKITG
jgi:hypothetical protein